MDVAHLAPQVHIRDICVFLAPLFSGLTAISTYFLTKELWSQGAGLFAACFIAIVPGYISRWVKYEAKSCFQCSFKIQI